MISRTLFIKSLSSLCLHHFPHRGEDGAKFCQGSYCRLYARHQMMSRTEWPIFAFGTQCFLLLRSSMVLPQMVSPVVCMKVVTLRKSFLSPHSCSCSVAEWGHCCVLTSLKRGMICGRTCSGDCVLSDMGSFQCVPALLMYPDCVLSGNGSLCHVPALAMYQTVSCLAWAVFSMCQFQSCTQAVGLSGMGSLQYVPALVMYTDSFHCMPALVMYPGCGPVWHGHSSVCASPSHVHGQFSVCAIPCHVLRLWSCLAWTVFSMCQL